jgi:hypothetical protein
MTWHRRPPPASPPPEPPVTLYAVIGRFEDEPIIYHMNLPWVRADHLRVRREAAIGRPCYVVPMAASHHDPRAALQRAEQERFGTP